MKRRIPYVWVTNPALLVAVATILGVTLTVMAFVLGVAITSMVGGAVIVFGLLAGDQ